MGERDYRTARHGVYIAVTQESEPGEPPVRTVVYGGRTSDNLGRLRDHKNGINPYTGRRGGKAWYNRPRTAIQWGLPLYSYSEGKIAEAQVLAALLPRCCCKYPATTLATARQIPLL